MEIRPILSALWRNRTGAVLVALQVAITLAVVVNAAFIIHDRTGKMARPSGIDSENILTVVNRAYDPDYDFEGGRRADLDALRAIPGVVSASEVNTLPLSGGGWSLGLMTDPEQPETMFPTAGFATDEMGLATFGLELIEGRWFRKDEIITFNLDAVEALPQGVVLSLQQAEHMFPDESAVGKLVYLDTGDALTVIGVVNNVATPWPGYSETALGGFYRSIFVPALFQPPTNEYAVRTEPGQAERLLPVVEKTLAERANGRVISGLKLHRDIVGNTYGADIATTRTLISVIVLLVVITSLGIVGLASFNVRQRTKQIGTRRALGATRGDILRYFMLENVLVTSIGLAIGTVFTLGLNMWLVQSYSVPRLDVSWVPFGIVFLLLLGQAAVLAPARRATRVSPAIATRTV